MKRKTKIKISRGRLEEERRKSEDWFEYQKVMLFILPLLMLSVLALGIYFGYLSYTKKNVIPQTPSSTVAVTEATYTDEQTKELLRIVSSALPVDSSFVPEISDYNGVKVSTYMVDDLTKMMDDAKASKLDIKILSGYISFEEQKEIYDKAVADYKKKNKCSIVKAEAAIKQTIPAAGQSEQQTGLLLELSNSANKDFEKSKEFNWLIKNSVNYGFILRYSENENTGTLSYSPNMFRYVGVNHAQTMRAYNMSLDEYVQYLGLQ